MFGNFYGNANVAETLRQILQRDRIPQTILLAGPEGVGKATLARRFGGVLLGGAEKIERDDLSLDENAGLISEREKWPADKRAEDPLVFASHPDFLTFPPDGPLRQISIQQMRLLKDRVQFKPLRGKYRVFLIDHLDRANEQAANSLLKTLEEPPEHAVFFLTAENAYDLLPTIRSRSVMFQMARLHPDEITQFVKLRRLKEPERRIALAAGSPGVAVSLDLDAYDRRKSAMLSLLQAASGEGAFGSWARISDGIGSGRQDKLDHYLQALYSLIEDVLLLQHGSQGIRNIDIRRELDAIAKRVSFEWLRAAVAQLDELVEMARRNVQKGIALDALVIHMQGLRS
jgi:DNA polymerase-3 subunit delta'